MFFLEVSISQLDKSNNYRYYVGWQVCEKEGYIEVEVEESLRRGA